MGKMNKLPDRWLHYIPLGRRIPGTRFIAFKVPLSGFFDSKLSPKQRFSPMDLIRKIKEQKEELGLIIDLTCTSRYYDPKALPKTLAHLKIFTAGKVIPDAHTIRQFQSTVTTFLTENADNDKLIGVHCTHGLNRTGYLVCRYLIDVEGMDPDMAIEMFQESRGHLMERQNFIQDLQGKPASNDLDHKRTGDTVHRVQECVRNGIPSKRAACGHQDQPPWFAPAWQHQGPQRLPPPPVTYHHGQDDRGYPAYHPPQGSISERNWSRVQQWEQNGPAPSHIHFPDYKEPHCMPPLALPSPTKQLQVPPRQQPHDLDRNYLPHQQKKRRMQ
ncbi:RNA/RNP complex-1-interacting phosphatase isoform X5 [Ambystoma mexicanum]|uniref:RNA/RNP complex-1-interacting phosphatase isoform X5 n=1 Tax=Ambystoma mexicanum TaxID=8296 RepID=UPI0037E97060